ncbi:hypothetical protein NUU61_000014 [Penicillium alfredii]|uniref:Uncharacterized protein n=1 Tax=Penicillium alfredii TaxID=1506179 RepID=A0A9W9KQ84_9EURO|nr:uncharacterized protein NUU61_000014 [Penicillium alfredii]KAJ5114255.1 hypothetical protein NUU61_000014 [Penicillium alfredii]
MEFTPFVGTRREATFVSMLATKTEVLFNGTLEQDLLPRILLAILFLKIRLQDIQSLIIFNREEKHVPVQFGRGLNVKGTWEDQPSGGINCPGSEDLVVFDDAVIDENVTLWT